jgi:hypothetical protein
MDVLGQTPKRRRRRNLFPAWDQLDNRCLLAGMSPAQLTAAYGLQAITFTSSTGSTIKGDGSGGTIALIEAFHNPTIASDLNNYDQAYGLPAAHLTVDNLAGNAIDSGWGLEESLDVEVAHAIAPGANLLVVEASSPSLESLLAAVNMARKTPGVEAISMSWGFNEFEQETAFNNTFTTPAGHTGITFLASSGDSGPQAGPEWPSVAPTVVAVGGTSLFLGSTGVYQSESAWGGSSGGYSRFEPEPEFQRSVQRTGKRSSPDVSFVGNPETGVSVYQTSPLTGLGTWYVVGGTSVGAPAWAAIIAIADQGRAIAGKGSLDGGTETLPTLYALAPGNYNPVSPVRRMRLTATATANTATGLGTPVGPNLISGLVASDLTVSLTSSSSATHSVRKAYRVQTRSHVARAVRARINITGTVNHAEPPPSIAANS